MWVAFFFPLLMISLPQEINVLKKTKNKVFATLSFQGLCSTLTFRESFLPSNFRGNSHKKKKSFCRTANVSAPAARARSRIVTLNWGNWWKETEKQKRNKSKRPAEFIQETYTLLSKEKGLSKSHPSPARGSQHHLRSSRELCWRDDGL